MTWHNRIVNHRTYTLQCLCIYLHIYTILEMTDAMSVQAREPCAVLDCWYIRDRAYNTHSTPVRGKWSIPNSLMPTWRVQFISLLGYFHCFALHFYALLYLSILFFFFFRLYDVIDFCGVWFCLRFVGFFQWTVDDMKCMDEKLFMLDFNNNFLEITKSNLLSK